MARVALAEHFEDLEKQAHAARLGMWIFLTSELMLFAGLFALYAFYRTEYGSQFAEAAEHASLAIGTINTFVLITSSFVVAMSIHAVRHERPRRAAALLSLGVLMGAGFLVLKGFEYAAHIRVGIEPGAAYHYAALPGDGARIFFTLYYTLTGLHALHVLAGMGLLTWIALLALTGLTFGVSFVSAGAPLHMAVAMVIAAAKASLVAFFFMHLVESPAANRIVFLVGVVFVAILVSLSAADIATR